MWNVANIRQIIKTLLLLNILLCREILAGIIDNEIIGDPKIECRDSAIIFSISTKNSFRGNIYVRAQFGIGHCRREFYTNNERTVTFGVALGDCGMAKMRQLQPSGLDFMVTIVVSFHPQFVTKVDRSFNVNCFYAQTSQNLEADLKVEELPPLSIQRDGIMFPKCEYSIRSETVDGPTVRSVNVGDPIVHRWSCGTNSNFGMLVKNCLVSDGGAATDRVLDERGCPTKTSVIQGQLSYDESLSLAFVPVLAFSFPDRSLLTFRCQIQYCNKAEGECMGVSPPNCPTISPGDYSPNSEVNPNVDPTQVIATFTSPQYPFTNYPQNNNNNVGYTALPRPYPPSYAQFPGVTGSANGIFSDPSYQSSYGTRRQTQSRNDKNKITTTNDYNLDAVNDHHQQQERLHNFTVFNKAHKQPVNSMEAFKSIPSNSDSSRLNGRTRRAEAQTIDVVAEPVQIVQDLVDDELIPHTSKNPQRTTFAPSPEYCTNRYGLATLITVFGLLSGFCMALAAYVFNDLVIGRNKCRKGVITSRRDSAFVTYANAHSNNDANSSNNNFRQSHSAFPFARLPHFGSAENGSATQ